MITRRQLFGAGCLGLCGVAGVMLARAFAGNQRAGRVQIVGDEQCSLKIEKTPAQAGVLVIKARAVLGDYPMNLRVWWFIDVRKIDPTTRQMSTVLARDYDNQKFAHLIGAHFAPTFEERLEMLPGKYSVLVGLRESRRVLHEDGTEEQFVLGAVSTNLFVL